MQETVCRKQYSRNSTHETVFKKQCSRNSMQERGMEEEDQLAPAEYVSLEHPAAGPHWHSAMTQIYQQTDTNRLIDKYKYTNMLIQILMKMKTQMCH